MHRIFGGRGTGASSFTRLSGSRVWAEHLLEIRSALATACSPAAMKERASANPRSASGRTPSSLRSPAAEPPFLAKLIRRTALLYSWRILAALLEQLANSTAKAILEVHITEIDWDRL